MKYFLIVLLIVFLALGIVGFLVKALLWLAFLGFILFALTAVYWWFRVKQSQSSGAAEIAD
ncbi:hypothetical protein [Demequina oxidasica]|uniref:hypothetical protein n=1 Tax=Demequina oxidasica TaxID=676199 RepID=UPI00078298F7|nr:hypothetical protein [Demequina oxidasica]